MAVKRATLGSDRGQRPPPTSSGSPQPARQDFSHVDVVVGVLLDDQARFALSVAARELAASVICAP